MKKNRGFTLLELIISVAVISTMSLVAISGIISRIPDFKAKEDIKVVEQALKNARSTAIKKSCTIKADFSKATSNNGDNGGVIEIKDADGVVLDSANLSHNMLLNTSLSTIDDNIVSFDYRGQPVDPNGSVDGFNNTNNKITISYYDGYSAKYSKSLIIFPMTGNIADN